jgi:hypothetical protein
MTNQHFPDIHKLSALPAMICEGCLLPLHLRNIEPASRRFDLRTFGCASCDSRETIVVELDQVSTNESGWWERPKRAR